jgi:ectoine hydroxylase-related dioxygenase (phytanoyl-CoA dioxygenase family)
MSPLQDFDRDGFAVRKGFLGAAETAELERAVREAQVDVAESSSLDRVGLVFKHNLFRRSKRLQDFVSSEKVVHLLREFAGPDFWVRWDQSIEKVPGGAPFPWHQDNGYSGLRDPHYQLWIALTSMTRENGGLWLQRGSHLRGIRGHGTQGPHVVTAADERDAVFIDAQPGDALVFSSFLLHKTDANSTDSKRLAYVIEYMSLDHFDPYIEGPYFVAARGGESAPEFVRYFRGRLSPATQLKYLRPRLERGARVLRHGCSKLLGR